MTRINHNVPSMITGGALRQVGRQMNKVLERLSTGLRVNRAADDAAGLAVSEQLRTQVRGIGMAKRNCVDGISTVQIAEGALNSITDILQRMRELAIQADSQTLTDADRGYLQTEFDNLRIEIDRIAASNQFNGMTLLDGAGFGAGAGSTMHVGANNTVNDRITVTIGSITAAGLTLTTVSISTMGVTGPAIVSIDTALGTVLTRRASLGAIQNRLEYTLTNLENQEHNMQAAESSIRDTDFAEATAQFSRDQIITQSATAMLAQANQIPQSILTLLQG